MNYTQSSYCVRTHLCLAFWSFESTYVEIPLYLGDSYFRQWEYPSENSPLGDIKARRYVHIPDFEFLRCASFFGRYVTVNSVPDPLHRQVIVARASIRTKTRWNDFMLDFCILVLSLGIMRSELSENGKCYSTGISQWAHKLFEDFFTPLLPPSSDLLSQYSLLLSLDAFSTASSICTKGTHARGPLSRSTDAAAANNPTSRRNTNKLTGVRPWIK